MSDTSTCFYKYIQIQNTRKLTFPQVTTAALSIPVAYLNTPKIRFPKNNNTNI